ncbi:hypothetical protein QTP88_018504 [Uroleucon formosanum]
MASRDRDKFRSHPSVHQKRLKKAKVEGFMQKQRGCLEKFVINSVSKNDGIENTDMNCEVREASNVNKNITGLQNVQNLTSPLDVQETQNTLNDRYVCDLNDPGCWPSEITHNIRIEIVSLVRENIVKIIKAEKYLSIMMDCTPDVINLELESETSAPKIEEYFLDFISVESTTGLHLTNLLVSKLQEYNIDLLDCHGQGYDNGSNMKGQYQGVQSRMKQLNYRAFFTPCATHNLNLLLGDISKSSTKAISFFGIVQRIYCLFSSSTKRWSILKKHCQELTLNPCLKFDGNVE